MASDDSADSQLRLGSPCISDLTEGLQLKITLIFAHHFWIKGIVTIQVCIAWVCAIAVCKGLEFFYGLHSLVYLICCSTIDIRYCNLEIFCR